jgi:cell division protein DivIC
MLKKFKEYIPKRLRNKWFLTGFAFFIWLLFFEEISFVSLVKAKIKILHLQNEWVFKESKIKEAKEKRALIIDDVEKYAREVFWMKKDNEEIFIISQKK